MRKILRRAGQAAAMAAVLWATAAAAGERMVVVELFTSQGCSSCPPADRLVAALARRSDVLVLSFHVDYWNYIGWEDPNAIPESTRRQRAYGKALNKRYVYTPQIVIDGKSEVSGSALDTVEAKLAAARRQPKLAIAVQSNPRDGVAEVQIPAGPHVGPPADVWVALYDRTHTNEVGAGENRGRMLTSVNVVRAFQRIGAWRGEAITMTLPLVALGAKGRDACAIIVQHAANGPIVGARPIPLP